MALFSCKKGEGTQGVADRVVLSAETVNLKVDESTVVTARVFPESLGMGVTWEVMDTAIVSCDNGLIKGKTFGVTYLVATSADGLAKSSCMVSVNPDVKYSVSIIDEYGNPLSAVYGYPGQKLPLTAYTSDGETHTFTWNVEDAAVAEVTDDGVVTLKAVTSQDSNYYVYDAQTFISVATEEGFGCRIPLRSNLVNGIVFGEEATFYPAGTTVLLEASKSYPFALLYTGVEDQLVDIPAGGINYSISDPVNFVIEATGNDLTLNTGSKDGISATLTILPAGTEQGVEIAQFEIEKSYDIKAKLSATSSSSLVFTWTEGTSVDADVANAYTATLYKDSGCTVIDQSFDFESGCAAWNGKQPKFVFGGLEPSTDYWLKVLDTTNGLESGLIKATTDAFTVVEIPSSITETGVVLAEDFGEIRWDFDYVAGAGGYKPTSQSDFNNTEVKEWRYPGQGAEMTFKGQGTALGKSSRLNGWITDSNVYIHPGYLKLGTASGRGWILTPEFTVPDGKKAIVNITITACRYNTSQDAQWAVMVIRAGHSGADPGAHSASFDWPDKTDATICQFVDFSNTGWTTKTAENFELLAGDRIAFGGVEGGSSSKGRVNISDLTVTVTEIK